MALPGLQQVHSQMHKAICMHNPYTAKHVNRSCAAITCCLAGRIYLPVSYSTSTKWTVGPLNRTPDATTAL